MLSRSLQRLAKYDVAVVGGGPGGYVCALKAAQLGLNTVCIEKRDRLGGTCLNVGCIPSKSLLHASHKYHDAAKHFKKSGITFDNLNVDVPTMIKQKEKAIKGLTGGIAMLFKSAGVTHVSGKGATFGAGGKIVVEGGEEIEADNVVVAVGSKVSVPPGIDINVIDEKDVVSSTGALEFTHVPESLIVIGGGVIGLELGSVWSRLGAKTDVVEFMPGILGGIADAEVAKGFQKSLAKQGFNFNLSCKVVDVKVLKASGPDGKGSKVAVTYEDMNKGETVTLEAEKVLLSVGRSPNTRDIGLEEAFGVELNRVGQIPIDDDFKVKDGVYAIGDCVQGPMLAHKAEEDGHFVAEHIAEQKFGAGTVAHKTHINYNAVPSVVYTYPEVAWVGKTEEQLTKEGIGFKKASFPMAANSRARANDDSEGFVKVLVDDQDRVLGAHIIASLAGDLIHPFVQAVQFGYPCHELAHTCMAHPTQSEAVKEAAMRASLGKWIHMPN